MTPTFTAVPAEVVNTAKASFATYRPGAVQAKLTIDDEVVDVGAAARERLIVAEADGFVITLHVQAVDGCFTIRGGWSASSPTHVAVELVTGIIEVENVGAEFIITDVPKGPMRIVLSPSVGGADVVTDWVLL